MNTNPFFPFGSFDADRFDLTKLLGATQIPGVDMQALLAAQSKNIEALAEANKLAMEGMQAIAKRQMEILTQTMSEASKAASTLTASGDPREKMMQQTQLAKTAFEQAIANMRELADMVQQSNRQAADIISKRVSSGLEEVKDLTRKR